MNTTQAIFARRAIRAYSALEVDAETIRALTQAAVQAPSAMNRQPWLFAIVQNRTQLKRYSDRAKDMLRGQAAADPKTIHYAALLESPDFNIFYDASTLIVIGAAKRDSYTDADGWVAAMNLMLAATDAGLGTCPIGFATAVLNSDEVKQELKIPPGGVAVAAIIVGHPASAVAPVERKAPTIVSWSH